MELHGQRDYHMGRKKFEGGIETVGSNRNGEGWKTLYPRQKVV